MTKVIDTIEHENYDEYAERFAARITAVKAIRIQNDRTIRGIKEIRLFMQTATGTGDNAGASLTAPTRGGKTTIIQEFRSAFTPDPQVATEKMPIVYVETPSGTGTSSLGMAILNALGDMNPSRGDGAYKQALITKAIRRRETKLLIIDEIQRLVAKDRGRVAHNVSDWIQNLLNQISGTCGILLVGTTRARRIFRRNGHLVGRSDHHFEIKPYGGPTTTLRTGSSTEHISQHLTRSCRRSLASTGPAFTNPTWRSASMRRPEVIPAPPLGSSN